MKIAKQNCLSLLLVVLLGGVLFHLPGHAQRLSTEELNPFDILRLAQFRWEQTDNYTAQMAVAKDCDGVPINRKITFWYEKPNRVRVEYNLDKKKPDVLIRSGNDLFHSTFKWLMTKRTQLTVTDPLVMELFCDQPFFGMTWQDVLDELDGVLKSGGRSIRDADEMYNFEPCYVISVVSPTGQNTMLRHQLWVTKDDNYMVRHEISESGTMLEKRIWWKIKTNQDFADDLFEP